MFCAIVLVPKKLSGIDKVSLAKMIFFIFPILLFVNIVSNELDPSANSNVVSVVGIKLMLLPK